MIRSLARWLAGASIFFLATAYALAGVTVTQNTGPGATSWPSTPIVSTVANPAAQAIVGEGFSGSTTSSYGQTFTVPAGSDYRLESIYLYVGGGTGTSTTAPLTLHLYNLGGRLAPNPNTYSPPSDLLGGGSGLAITYTTQPNGLLRLDFTDSDQIVLRGGRMYAFEISSAPGTNPMSWLRAGSDTYSGGVAYRSRAWINGNSARDFALAVYGTPASAPDTSNEAEVNSATLHQRIDGFGAGVVFLDSGLNPLTDEQMDQLYGSGPGQFGLTLIRVRISPAGNYVDALENGRKAHERGARILASPWTPPAAMKSNNNVVGGHLLPSEYGSYVAHLNGFLESMAAYGAPVSVISIQNEPDIAVTYESADWTAEQLRTFSRDYAGAINAPVMMPESYRFDQAVSNPTLNDPVAAANVDYIGGHLYGTGVRDYPLARSLGKPIWMTEYLINDQTIGSALSTAEQINETLTSGNMSAYIWWKTIGNANGLLNAAGAPQPRGYVMGQFSRFVRPGDFRVDVPSNTGPLSISAFKDPTSGRFAIILVNNTAFSERQTINLDGIASSAVTPWVTSAFHSLQEQSPVNVIGGGFTYDVPAQSIITFAGVDAPRITTDTNASASFGVPFQFVITAAHSPTSYSAEGLPPGLEIDATTGVISGTPTAAGEYNATVTATNAGGSDTKPLRIDVVKANASLTLRNQSAIYDGTPRVATVTTEPAGLPVSVTYNGLPAAIYPGSYTVVATIDDPNYIGVATATLDIGITALVRHLGSISGAIQGSVQVLTPENVTLNGGASVSGDLLVPGAPGTRINGSAAYAGDVEGAGSQTPSSHVVTLNGRAALRHIVSRIDPLTLASVASPPAPAGVRDVVLNSPADRIDDFTMLRDLTLNGNAGLVTVPPGSYGKFTANGGALVLGTAGAVEPALYNLQGLTLNGRSRIEIQGPVILVMSGSLSISNSVTFSSHPADWLELQLASGGLTLNGNAQLSANVIAPNGAVVLNGGAKLQGTLKADRLIVNGNGRLVER